MTIDKAKSVINELKLYVEDLHSYSADDVSETLEFVIKALEQKPNRCDSCTHSEEQDGSNCYECVKGMADNFEAQPTDADCISRKEALKVMCENCPMYNCVCGCPSYRHIEKMPSVTPKARWIPVSERLPKYGELVLFSTKTGEVFEGRYFDDDTNRQWYAFQHKTYAWDNVVTAWMPLPEPYKESEVNADEDSN